MVKMPSSAQINKNYRAAIPGVAASYKEGINSSAGWKDAAMKGQGLFEQRMSDPAVLKKREQRLALVNESEWKAKAANLGSQRISSGMSENADKQSRNYEPIRAALESVQLAERSADPMANIDARVKPIVKAAIDASRR